MSQSFDVVVAADEDGGIGRGGGLPWRLPGEMKHFVAVTRDAGPSDAKNAVVMGRRTWASIPDRFRPLPGRRNVVVSRAGGDFDGAEHAPGFDAALELLADHPGTIFVIGGAQLYTEALAHPGCRHVYLTRIHARYDCDTMLPPLEPTFSPAARLGEGQDGDVRYTFERWDRR